MVSDQKRASDSYNMKRLHELRKNRCKSRKRPNIQPGVVPTAAKSAVNNESSSQQGSADSCASRGISSSSYSSRTLPTSMIGNVPSINLECNELEFENGSPRLCIRAADETPVEIDDVSRVMKGSTNDGGDSVDSEIDYLIERIREDSENSNDDHSDDAGSLSEPAELSTRKQRTQMTRNLH
jgi:hypothetical protein